MVDYISPNPGYGFITMLPYQHAGGIEYNAFHNAGVRCELGSTPFLPAAWRKVVSERDGKKPYQNLWIVSRGPDLARLHAARLRPHERAAQQPAGQLEGAGATSTPSATCRSATTCSTSTAAARPR